MGALRTLPCSPRPALVLSALVFAASVSSPAAADDTCTCGVLPPVAEEQAAPLSQPETFASVLAAATRADLADPLNASQETVGDAALSLPGDALSSQLDIDPVPTPERVLWCEDADDPRCSQDAGQSEAPELTSPNPTLVTGRAQDDPRHGAVKNGWRAHLGDAAGVRRDLDRPPCG